MQIKQVSQAFISIVKSAINGTKLLKSVREQLTDEFLVGLFKISNFHDLAHIVSYKLTKEGISLPESFIKKENLAKYRFGIHDFETERIKSEFEEEKVAYFILKGATIRSVYPEQYLRTSCDIDVLVKKEDVKKAEEIIIKKIGAKLLEEKQHDNLYQTESGVNIELHFSLGYTENAKKLLNLAWKSGEKVFGEYGLKMPDELLNAYLIFHMANHFKGGGCGVKVFMDLHLLRKNKGFNAKTGEEYIKEIGLDKFSEYAYALADYWFNGGESNQTITEMEKFVIGGGVYGTLQQKTQVESSKTDSNYYKRRIFLPFAEMKSRYRKLEKYPILLPYYTLKRWFSLLSGRKRKVIKQEIKYKKNFTDDKLQQTDALLKELGINS